MTVESLRVKQQSLRSSFTMCCSSIEDALKRDTSLPDLYALQRQIMDKFARLDTEDSPRSYRIGVDVTSESQSQRRGAIFGYKCCSR
ncbi:hypothetical protein TNCV_4605621 [Trichonephila clavipes]|nr:hypothetical protein TNCV_4605621 [Trichonephila clavipes]